MRNVRRLLQRKTKGVWTVLPDTTVLESIQLMVDKDVGALVVMEGEQIAGIVTERDLTRRLLLKGKKPEDTYVREIMTERVLVVNPERSIEDCMALMMEKNIRHLPIIEHDKLIGLVSIRDVIRCVISDQQFMIEQLEHYITGKAPHMQAVCEA